MKKLIIILLAVFMATTATVDARGSFGGGSRSFSRPSYTPTRYVAPTKYTAPAPTKVVTPTRRVTPTKVTTPTVKPVVKPTPKPVITTTPGSPKIKVNGQTISTKGTQVTKTKRPTFSGGYTAPIGSTVYYRESSIMDWLPFYMIMTMNSSGGHAQATVVTPASSSTPATLKVVTEEGIDTMYVINWIITIAFCLLIIGGIVWLINKKTYKESYV